MKTAKEIREEKKSCLEFRVFSLKEEIAELEAQNKKAEAKGIESWLGNSFESSSCLTEEFDSFYKQYRKELKAKLKGFELVNISRGHFDISGFVKNTATEKLAYFSTSDVRYSPDNWYNNILVRTAQHDKDYSGGRNDNANWNSLFDKLINLTA